VSKVLLLIPPLTQLNTPYPATAYLTGFLKGQGISIQQGDLGLDMVLAVFHRKGLVHLFDAIEDGRYHLHDDLQQMVDHRISYEETIDDVIAFLQNKNYTLAYRVVAGGFLPEGPRFHQAQQMEEFFGTISTQDMARYLCTLYLEDLGDLIQETVGPHFGFAKYAERIAQTAVSFKPIQEALEAPNNYFDTVLLQQAAKYFEDEVPMMVGLSVPFPGNLYGALKVGQWMKQYYPNTKVVLGGGYANTELRELYDPAVFNYVDYITLDDGEGPVLALYNYLKDGTSKEMKLLRTYACVEGKVEFINNLIGGDFAHKKLPAPSYEGLRLSEYLSMFDVPNPMHRMWNDGRWNKLTIAHGCYWKKCTFCDITLDYISRYDPAPAAELVDKMEALIKETGERGFHFVDEAAPPLAMRDLALEILRRGLQVTWWTNIRFEKTFTPDLCKLLAASGCIAVTGGLEVADQRLLDLIKKGITIEQVTKVTAAFRDVGILVHAYLMYGFPTQTEQETVDSLEIVRQLFEQNLLQSAYWHRFAMTVHSPVGKDPAAFNVIRTGPEFQGFANNDLFHEDPSGAEHGLFSDGLKKALYNYMHGNALDFPLDEFFDFSVPRTQVPSKLIAKHLKRVHYDDVNLTGYVFMWHRIRVREESREKNKVELLFTGKVLYTTVVFPKAIAEYILQNASRFEAINRERMEYQSTLNDMSALLNITSDELVKQPWYIEWRKEVLWLMKL
jgi:radical SAM superfamily enzyme YgiQ (UPF0313 family)